MLEDIPKISGYPFDIKAEVLARMICEHYDLELEQLLYEPSYWHQRQGRRDVISLNDDFSHRLEKHQVNMETSRESMFDRLPEFIFLHPEEQYGNNVRQMQALTEQEANARKFLLPFDQLFFWLRLENEFKESESEASLEMWWNQLLPSPELEKLSTKQKKIIWGIIPHLQQIIGNWAITGQCLELLTGHKVQITEEDFPEYKLPMELNRPLGKTVLGKDFILGKTFRDGIPAISIRFEDLEPADLIDLLPGGEQRALLDNEILPLFIPIETPFFITLDSKWTEEVFKIEPENEVNVLGYTMHL